MLLIIFYVFNIVLYFRDIVINKIDRIFVFFKFIFYCKKIGKIYEMGIKYVVLNNIKKE